jgi:hypothetical protein
MELIKREPSQIVHHLFNHKSFCLNHSQLDNLRESSMNKTGQLDDRCGANAKIFSKYKNETSSLSYDQLFVDETLENFWDITSPEEFNDFVRKVFEQD